jgi:putative oxidoreductase
MQERTRSVLLWIATAVVAFVFISAGAFKFLDPETTRANFEGWGYPGWFGFVIGAVELLSGGLILWPRLASYAGTVLVADMTGATITHALNSEWMMMPVTMVLGLLALSVAWARRAERVRFGARRAATA